MCKILIVPGIKPEYSKPISIFIKKMGEKMSTANRDGLGYAAISRNGEFFGERWTVNEAAFLNDLEPIAETPANINLDERIKEITDSHKDFLFSKYYKGSSSSYPNHAATRGEYNSWGPQGLKLKDAASVILHTRMATTPKNLANTHPFVRDNTALIHNGVISNYEKLKLITSTCDSESILNSYIDHNVISDPTKMNEVADELSGYYACGVLTKLPHSAILDVFKNETASLWFAYIKEWDQIIISTAHADIKSVADEMRVSIAYDSSAASGNLVRYNAMDGSLIGVTKFDTKSFSSFQHYDSYGYGCGYNGQRHQRPAGGNVIPYNSVKGAKRSRYKNKEFDFDTQKWVDVITPEEA